MNSNIFHLLVNMGTQLNRDTDVKELSYLCASTINEKEDNGTLMLSHLFSNLLKQN